MGTDAPQERPQSLLRWPTYVMGKLHRSGTARIDEALADGGLSLRDYYVLACIDEGGELAQQQVADRLEIDRSDLVKVLDRLEAAGWITRARDATDRRRHVLSLTGSGRAAVSEAEAITDAVTQELLEALSEPEQGTLLRLLRKAFRSV